MNNMTKEPAQASVGDHAFAIFQHIIPTLLLSRIVHWATRIEAPWFKQMLINGFMRGFKISLDEYQVQNPNAFKTFNEFFTRALLPGARPQAEGDDIALCPVDGTVSQAGDITQGRIFQAKGQDYSVIELLGGNSERAAPFLAGRFATLYLAPYNYHRIHMPQDATLREMVYIPGKLFSVNAATARTVPRVFARNERVACLYDTANGPMAMVLVGALFVGSIETVWAGEVTPGSGHVMDQWQYDADPANEYNRGQEMGRFNMGSTVIMLYGPGGITWDDAIRPNATIRLGQALGRIGG